MYDTCDKQKRQRQHFVDDEHHHVTRALNKDVSELVFHVQSWPRAARRWTRGTARDDTNAAGEHHNMTGFLESGSLRQPSPKRLRRNTTSYPKNTTDKEPEVTSLCSATHPCATFECIFRRGAFVHNQREHEARPRTTEHPRTVSAHHTEH